VFKIESATEHVVQLQKMWLNLKMFCYITEGGKLKGPGDFWYRMVGGMLPSNKN